MSETMQETQETWPEMPQLKQTPEKKKRGRPKKTEPTLNQENDISSSEISEDKKPRVTRGRKSSLETDLKLIDESLSSIFSFAYVGLLMVNQADAAIIEQRSPQVVKSVVNVARVDSKFREFLVKGLSASVYGELAFSVFLLIIPILHNHNLLPPSFSFFGPTTSTTVNGYGTN